jgi:3-hydroxymyristoyl/3-hydroxydecanoyl-(acyl carrier protein) dehydratase
VNRFPLSVPADVSERDGLRVVTVYSVDSTEPVLAGHFPGFALFPGICLLECAHQAALLAIASSGVDPAVPELVAIERARFLQPVFPGDRVRTEVNIEVNIEVSAEVSAEAGDGVWRATVRSSASRGGDGTSRDVAVFKLRYGAGGTGARADGTGARADARADGGAPPPPAGGPGLVDVTGVLPHRFPMLLVDRVIDLVAGQSLVAVKAVTANEPCFSGLPDGVDPVYPPALLVESWTQAAAVLAFVDQPNPDVLTGRVTLFGSITNLELYAPVRPADLVHRVRLVRLTGDLAVLEGESFVDNSVVMRVGSIIMALRPAGELAQAYDTARARDTARVPSGD